MDRDAGLVREAHDRPAGRFPVREACAVDASGEPLTHPVILVQTEEGNVLLEDLDRDLDKVLLREAGIEIEVSTRVEQAVDVLVELEDLPVESPLGATRSIRHDETAIENRIFASLAGTISPFLCATIFS